jgi:hypothetical protein
MPVKIMLLLSLIPVIFGSDFTKSNAHVIMAVFGVVGIVGFWYGKNLLSLLTPNALAFLYIVASISLGAWGFSNGLVILDRDLDVFHLWQHADIALTIIMISLAVMLAVEQRFQSSYQQILTPKAPAISRVQMAVIGGLTLPFFIIPLNLNWLGGDGDLAIVPKTVFAICGIIFIAKFNLSIRFLFYIGLIIFFSTFSIHEKREAIFLALPMAYIELMRNARPLSLGMVLGGLGLLCILAILILGMSISRGYGGFGGNDDIFESIPLVLEYIQSDFFIASFLYNIEANYYYFHALNSIEMIVSDPGLISFGSTIIKPLFIFVPRYIFEGKPESIISLYTWAYDPDIRSVGGSWPICILSEFFWNFGYLSPIAAGGLSFAFSKLQIGILRANGEARTFLLVFCLFAYLHTLTVVRGSGLDQYAVFLVFGGLFCWVADRFIKYATKPVAVIS